MPELLAWLALASVFDAPIDCKLCGEWNRPQEPFHVYGNTWYVGTGGLGAVLIDAGDGLVLLDGGLPQSAEIIDGNIRKLGFDPANIRFIGMSHAHYDHVGGVAALQRISGADVVASHDAAKSLRIGALLPDDPQFGGGLNGQTFPAVENVVAMHDGAEIEVGDVVLTLIYTPGHTAGGTSWTWKSCEEDACLDIVYVDSLTPVSSSGYRYSDGLGDKLLKTLDRIAALDCDILLSTHDSSFGLHEKLEKGRSAFIDPLACGELAQKTSTYLADRLKSERS